MKKLFLSLAACASILGASAQATWDMGGTTYNVDTLYHFTSGPGMTTTALRMEGAQPGVNDKIYNNVFYTTIDLTNPDLELRGVQAKDNPDVVENVKSMGERKNTQGNGQYIAGVNGDFFNMGGSPTRTNGHSLVEGKLYNAGVGGDFWNTWATYAMVDGAKDVKFVQNVTAGKTINFPDKQSHNYTVNGGRWTNYLVIYTPDSTSTGTNQWGAECAIKLIEGSIANNDAVFEVTSAVETAGNMTVPADGYVLSGVGDAKPMVQSLKVGDKLTMGVTVKYNGQEINPTQLIGGCSYIVVNGKVAEDKYMSSSIIDHFTTNQARTVIGYDKDRTKLIMLVVDKFTTNKYTQGEYSQFKASTGFALKRMAQIMVNLGCYTAMNFDGGGSSQLYNKELGIRNVPYGENGYLRPVANGFFAVSTTPVDNEIASIEVREKNVNVASGESFTPTVYGYNKYGVLVDNNVKGYSLTVAPSLGSTNNGDATFTANDAQGTTIAVVTLPAATADAEPIKCGVRILTNGGGEYVTSGDDNASIMITPSYVADEPLGVDKEPVFLTEQWHFVNEDYNDSWDGTVPNWASDNAVKSKACTRYATARNGRFYTVDMRSMSIAEITPQGELIPLYKLPSLEGRKVNGVDDYYGTAISTDDNGNFLVGHLFTKNDTYRVWTVYCPKTNKAKHFEIELPAGETSNGRIDNIGRVVGDLTSEAYAYVMPKATGSEASQKALIIHFTGNGDVDALEASATMSKTVWLAGVGNTNSIAQPKYATVAEMAGKDPNDTFYWYSKLAGVGNGYCDLFTNENGTTSPNYGLGLCNTNYSALNGFDTFVLAGRRYFVFDFEDEKATFRSNQHIVVMDQDGKFVAEWNNPDYTSGAGYNSIIAVPVNATQVNIYVYNCTGNLAGNGNGNGAIAGALLSFTVGDEYQPDETADITPEGYNFDNYADGDLFKLTATESNAGWSAPSGMVRNHPEAFTKDGHLTVYLDRGSALSFNTQSYIDQTVQPAYTVRKVNDHIGNALVVTQPWSPSASRYGWASAGTGGSQAQLNFYMPNGEITNKTNQRHYIRVRLVYNVLHRGCHYTQKGDRKLVSAIYASHENNWVVPALDHELGAIYSESGINFAQWVGETGYVDDIPATPEVRTPDADETDSWDYGHKPAGEDANGYPAYIINDSRYRVYEFDTYMDDPSAASLSVQFNMLNANTTFVIKEIKFTDLGTDEADAYLLGRRQLGWKYYNESTSGIEDIIAGDAVEGSDAPAVYYNLQGVEVKNPENGIYIVRRGNQVTKEFVR